MSYLTTTGTTTRTVVDVRKTFESFAADLDMIAHRTRKWDTTKVDDLVHDVLRWAEEYYVHRVDIVLLNAQGQSVRAVEYLVSEDNALATSDRAGLNNWPNLPDTSLQMVVDYTAKWKNLTDEQRRQFMTGQRNAWGRSQIDTSYPNLRVEAAQQYTSNGYGLAKTNRV